MRKLSIPYFPDRQMGQVIITLNVAIKNAELCIEGRQSTFDCLELTEVPYALLGVLPMQRLGLEPDLTNHKLRLLPMNSEQSYLTVL